MVHLMLSIPKSKLQDNIKSSFPRLVFAGISPAVVCTNKELDYGKNMITIGSIKYIFDNIQGSIRCKCIRQKHILSLKSYSHCVA